MRAETLEKLTASTLALLEREGMATFDRFARLGSRPRRHNGQPYRGGNVLPLWAEAVERSYGSPYWMTFKQAREQGAQVRKGSKGTVVVYWDKLQSAAPASDGEESRGGLWFAKSYHVFNACQIDGLADHYYLPVTATHRWGGDDRAEQFVTATGATICEGRGRACYRPETDDIEMPDRRAFKDAEAWYATVFHELVHWSGAKHRVDRDLAAGFKDKGAYALEELIAELGAALLCCDLGISKAPREDHAVYLASWMKALKEDPMCIYRAGKAADVAADWLLALAQPAAPVEVAA